MKKVSIFLVAAMLMGVLAGCGDATTGNVSETAESTPVSSETTVTPEVKEDPVTVIMRTRCANDASDMERVLAYVNELLLEKANIQLELQLASNIKELDQMNELSFAAEEAFDIIWMNSSTYSTYAEEGSVIPLDDLLAEYAPELLETIDQKYFDLSAYKGEHYAVPCQQIMVTYTGYMVQKQYFDEYGKLNTHLESYEDIYPFLDWLVEKHPEMYPVYGANLENVRFLQMYEQLGGAKVVSIKKDDPYTALIAREDMYKPVGLYYNWMQKGYVRSDMGKGVDESADLAANKYVVLADASRPGIEAEYFAKKGVEWVKVEVGEPYMTSASVKATMLGVPYTSKNPEAAVKLLNLLFTDAEVFNALMFGIEGVHYVMDPECDTHVKTVKDSGWNVYQGGWAFGNQFLMYTYDTQSKTVWEETKALNDSAIASPLGAFIFDPSSVETEIAQLNAVLSEYKEINRFEDSAEKYDEMMVKLKAAGYDKLKAEVEKQIADYLKK